MLEHLAAHERRNIRPFVLGVCFFCGLVFGFVFYVATPTFAKKQYEEEAGQMRQQAERNVQKQNESVPVQVAPSLVGIDRKVGAEPKLDVTVSAEETTIETGQTPREDMRKMPEPLPVAMRFDAGLSGRTTYRPLKPVKVDKPAPPVNFSTRPAPVRTAPGGEAALPELDD